METFGLWVRRHRRAAGFSQEGLATRVGVDRSYITRLESGAIRLPHLDTRARLHEVLGTSEEQLWREVDPGIKTDGATVTIGRKLDAALRDLTDADHLMVERLVEDVIRVARAMAMRGEAS